MIHDPQEELDIKDDIKLLKDANEEQAKFPPMPKSWIVPW